jgi:hypothetical protein
VGQRVTVVTGHQPNLLWPMSVVSKIQAADLLIVCCGFQMVRHGWVNRQKLADGTPLTIPYDNRDRYAPIGRVRIADETFRARKKVAKTLALHFGYDAEPYAAELARPYRRLAALNIALNNVLLDMLDVRVPQVRQSDLEAGVGSGPLVTADHDDMPSISEQLAAMTAEVGGTTWLSGPSGRNYLDETPFVERGIRVQYFSWQGQNHCALELLKQTEPTSPGLRDCSRAKVA